MRSGKHRGQKKQKRKGAYDKSGGITHDTAAFAFRTKDILKIRSRPRLEPGSDYHYLVHQEKPEHVCVLVFLFVHTMEGLERGGGAQRRKQSAQWAVA